MGSVEPLLEVVGQELEAKLETRVTFDLSRLWAHDLAGCASNFKAMVTAGMEIERAASLSGRPNDDHPQRVPARCYLARSVVPAKTQ